MGDPEAIIAMLACARLGAVHSVVFGGFAAQELARRIEHAEVSEQNFMLLCLLQCGSLRVMVAMLLQPLFLSWQNAYRYIFL